MNINRNDREVNRNDQSDKNTEYSSYLADQLLSILRTKFTHSVIDLIEIMQRINDSSGTNDQFTFFTAVIKLDTIQHF